MVEPPVIHVEGLTRVFGENTAHSVIGVHPTSFSVMTGEIVVITGRSGSGKSTLLNLLGLLDAPTSGQYLLAGESTAGVTEKRRAQLRRARIGFVFQASYLVGWKTTLENTMDGVRGSTSVRAQRAAASEALERVGMSHRAHSYPQTLSGGERQRVALARALVRQPDVLLCDEPTGNLDSETARRVIAQLSELNNRGVTLVVVTHDETMVTGLAGRRFRISDGVIAGRGVSCVR